MARIVVVDSTQGERVRRVVLPAGLGVLEVGLDAAGRLRRAVFVETSSAEEMPFEAFMAAPLRLEGTPFQLAVWREVMRVPRGETRTYGWVAARLGRPAAVRAVANAVAANPVAVRVPCHRIIRSDGRLGGYAWGEGKKRELLAWEGRF